MSEDKKEAPGASEIANTPRLVKETPETSGVDQGLERVIDPNLNPGSFADDVTGHVQGLGNLSLLDAQLAVAPRDMTHAGVVRTLVDQELEAASGKDSDDDPGALVDVLAVPEPEFGVAPDLASPNGSRDPLNPAEPEVGNPPASGKPIDPLDKNGNGVMDALEDNDDA